jgi:hypothetical protein
MRANELSIRKRMVRDASRLNPALQTNYPAKTRILAKFGA